jgi:hypothetical protein
MSTVSKKREFCARVKELAIMKGDGSRAEMHFSIEHEVFGDTDICIPMNLAGLLEKVRDYMMRQLNVIGQNRLSLADDGDPNIWLVCNLVLVEDDASSDSPKSLKFEGSYMVSDPSFVLGLYTDLEVAKILLESYHSNCSLAEDIQPENNQDSEDSAQ